MPVAIPEKLQKMGFTPEVFTSKVLDRIAYIKGHGSEYYRDNDIPLSTGNEEVELVSSLVAQTPLAEFKEAIISLVNRHEKKGVGEIVEWGKGFDITFRIEDKLPLHATSTNIDSLVHAAAVYVMETTDPYDLGAYYFVKEQYTHCLQLMQRLINDKKSKDKYLAMHIRGNVYIKSQDTAYARAILDSSLKMRTSGLPWLTYNSMGAIYQNAKQYEKAKHWYRLSIKANPNGYNALYNYGQVLLDEYYFSDQVSINNYPDSALYYFNIASANDPNNIKPYLGMLRAYVITGNVKKGKDIFYKCVEMDPDNIKPYEDLKDLAMFAGDTSLQNFCEQKLKLKNKVPD